MGWPVSACFHVASIMSAVHLGSPMLAKMGLGTICSDWVGQFFTQ
jgi:hypothetical protein